jgi:hypothetical protein
MTTATATATATPAPTCTPAMTHAEIVAACLAAIADRDPRIVAALDVIEAVARAIDNADLLGDRCRLALEALEQVEHILSRPTPSTVSQPAPVQAGPA